MERGGGMGETGRVVLIYIYTAMYEVESEWEAAV